MRRTLLALLPGVMALLVPAAAAAARPPCQPCAGVRVEQPEAVLAELAAPPRLEGEARLYVAWSVELDDSTRIEPDGSTGIEPDGSAEIEPGGSAATALDPSPPTDSIRRVEATGAIPWLTLLFRTPTPLTANVPQLERELRAAVRVARAAGPRTHFQISWLPASAATARPEPGEYAFLLKRAAVAITGARPEARIISDRLEPTPAALEALYAQEVGAYLDGVALAPAPAEALARAVAKLEELDPGRPVVLDSIPYPEEPSLALAEAARAALTGIDVTLFELARELPEEGAPAASLAPLKLLAREFQGDLSADPSSAPAGAESAWAFVRGEDLELRVLVQPAPGTDELVLRFDDPQLRRPARVDPVTGEAVPLAAVRHTASGLEVRLAGPEPVTVLRVARATAAELGGEAEEVTVAGERPLPVAEILRRLQAFEDAQARRLDYYEATNTTHLRFQAGQGVRTIEVTFQGPFFFRQGEGFDWAWQTLFVNGVRWRGERLPEIPLIQPERAAAVPLTIHLTKEYRYELVGSEEIEGRRAWVVAFEPAGDAEVKHLYRGVVWIDRELYARVRTRSLQLGLEGEVLSNEETLHYRPVDEMGRPAPWSAASFFLPLRTTGQQILSVINRSTVVEREVLLTDVRINAPTFEENRRQVLASDATMVRDTESGLRYLVKDEESGERRIKEGFDTSKWFALGGVFWDDALDYPLPLAGVNYFSFDFRGTGKQLNAFFGGALLTVSWADPRLFGSRFDAGADVFAIAVPFTDNLFVGDEEIEAQEVEVLPASLDLKLGSALGAFTKVNLTYEANWANFQRSDNTADGFRLPSDTLTHSLGGDVSFSRGGYSLGLGGSINRRSEWEPWGLPDNPGFDPDHQEYTRWGVEASKNWYLPGFQKIGFEVDHYRGSDLDRFSKYEFGFFGGTRVHGYQSNRVRASEVSAAHLSYGFEIGELLRLEALGDAAWATDEESRLDRELLGGVGLAGTFIGPWETVVNLDVGVPVAGPDDGFVAYLVFLKLFG